MCRVLRSFHADAFGICGGCNSAATSRRGVANPCIHCDQMHSDIVHHHHIPSFYVARSNGHNNTATKRHHDGIFANEIRKWLIDAHGPCVVLNAIKINRVVSGTVCTYTYTSHVLVITGIYRCLKMRKNLEGVIRAPTHTQTHSTSHHEFVQMKTKYHVCACVD